MGLSRATVYAVEKFRTIIARLKHVPPFVVSAHQLMIAFVVSLAVGCGLIASLFWPLRGSLGAGCIGLAVSALIWGRLLGGSNRTPSA